jgi:hypothetical protein
MRILEKLLKAGQDARKRLDHALGNEAVPLEVRRQILEQMQSRITINAGGNQFPYGKLIVELHPPAGALQDAFDAAFLQKGSLKADILAMLKGADARHPDPFEIIVDLKRDQVFTSSDRSPHPLFQLDFVKPVPSIKRELPETKLVISKGSAEQPSYNLKKERILIGCLQEVLDREGWIVRTNDVVFLDNGEDINSTVSRAHARIWFDFEQNEFFIMDEVSQCGTVVVREGRSIEVPAGNQDGIRLQTGDDIYCGQACLHFDLVNGPA